MAKPTQEPQISLPKDPNALINVKDPTGENFTVPLKNLDQALQMGYTLESKQQAAIREYVAENKGMSGSLAVGLSQFFDQATFGVGGAMMDHGKSDFERARDAALAKDHETANLLGGAAGFGASLLYGGPLFKGAAGAGHAAERLVVGGAKQAAKEIIPAQIGKAAAGETLEQLGKQAIKGAENLVAPGSALGEVGASVAVQEAKEVALKQITEQLIANGATKAAAEAAAPGLVRKMIGAGARYGVEGGVLSSPRAATELLLGDPDKAVESLLFGVGSGAAFGIGGGLFKEFMNYARPAVEAGLGKASGRLKTSALGIDMDNIAKENVDRFQSAVKSMTDEGVFSTVGGMPTYKGMFKKLNDLSSAYKNELGQLATTLDDKVAANSNLASDLFNGKMVADDIIRTATETGDLALIGQAKQLVAQMGKLQNQTMSFKEAIQLQDMLSKATRWSSKLSNEENLLNQHIFKSVSKEVDSAFQRVGGRLGEETTPFLERYLKSAERFESAEQILRLIDPEKITSKAMIAELGELSLGATVPSGVMSSARQAFNAATAGSLFAAGSAVTGGILWPVIGIAGRKALGTSIGKAYLASALDKAGLLFSEKAMANVARKMDEIPKLLMAGGRYTEADEHIFDKWSGEKLKANRFNQFKKIQEFLTRFQIDPQFASDQIQTITTPIANGAPSVADRYFQKQMEVYGFLYDKMPKNQKDMMVPFNKDAWKPSDQELFKFAQILTVVDNPFSVVQGVMNGTATRDQVTTLMTVYPKIYDEMYKRIQQVAYSPQGEKINLTYQQKTKMSLLLGVDVGGTTSGVMTLQQFYQPTKNPGQKKKLQLNSPNTGNPYLTSVQQIGMGNK